MRPLRLWLSLGMLLLPLVARADTVSSCTATAVTNLLGTSCAIGDKTFNFISFSGNNISASQVTLTPDANSALSPAFILTGINGAITVSGTSNIQGLLQFTVATTDGSA